MNNMGKFIDLGLSSGTLWAQQNKREFFTFNEAVKKFKEKLPTKEMFEELHDECEWQQDDERRGYIVTGKNGNSIFVPSCVGYWTSTPHNEWSSFVALIHNGELRCDFTQNHKYSNFIRLISKSNNYVQKFNRKKSPREK